MKLVTGARLDRALVALTLATLGTLSLTTPVRAQEATVAPESLWLTAGDTPPEGARNPQRMTLDGDVGLIGAGAGVLGGTYLATIVGSVLYLPGLRQVDPYGFSYQSHPCRDGALGAAFVPVLGPWLALAALDQCGIGAGRSYPSSNGGTAWVSVTGREDLGVDEIYSIPAVITGVGQAAGLAILIAGLLGHRTEIRFEAASLSILPITTTERATVDLRLTF